MKLYDFGRAPNPRRVRIYLAEKGIKVATEQVDLGAMQQESRVAAFLPILERQLEIGRFVCGARYSVADITALVAIDFMKPARLAIAPEHRNIARWYAEVSGRTSVAA